MLLQDDGTVFLAFAQFDPVDSHLRIASFDLQESKLNYMLELNEFNGNSASLARGFGAVYLGGSYSLPNDLG